MKRAFQILTTALLLSPAAYARPPGVAPAELPEQRLQRIVIPEIQFREAQITEVIDFLARETARLDPKKQGVNFVVLNPAGKPRAITLHLQRVPLLEAARYIGELAGLQVRVERSAIVFLDPEAASQRMETRVYHVSPATFEATLSKEAREPQLRRPE